MNEVDPSPDAREMVGIVVQYTRPLATRPHLAFMWGPEPAPVPSIAFGRQRARSRTA
jgi:hypothetical protein